MQEYDATLKALLQGSAHLILQQLTGIRVRQWHNVELPSVRQPRVDLLAETEQGELIHLELQSTNDPRIAVRMADYAVQVYARFGRLPRQFVIYVGEAELRMPDRLSGEQFRCEYRLLDIRSLDGQVLLNSPSSGDRLLAILARLPDPRAAVRQILVGMGQLPVEERATAFSQFLLLSGLRGLEQFIHEEARHMPILTDIMDHKVFGPILRQGMQQGLREGIQQGRQEGIQQGVQQGEAAVLQRLLAKRFGPLPEWVAARLSNLSRQELEDLSDRLLDARSLNELLPR